MLVMLPAGTLAKLFGVGIAPHLDNAGIEHVDGMPEALDLDGGAREGLPDSMPHSPGPTLGLKIAVGVVSAAQYFLVRIFSHREMTDRPTPAARAEPAAPLRWAGGKPHELDEKSCSHTASNSIATARLPRFCCRCRFLWFHQRASHAMLPPWIGCPWGASPC
jgi:hypothetical protein